MDEAYLIDRSGTSLRAGFEFVWDASASTSGSTNHAAGPRWDYDDADGVPGRRLRVLERWQG